MAKTKEMKQTVLIDLNELGLFNGLGDNSIWISEEVDCDLFETIAADTGVEEHLLKPTLNTARYLEAITDLYIAILDNKLNRDEFEDEFVVELVSADSIQIKWTGENAEERFEAFLSEVDATYQDHNNPRAAFELFEVYEEEGYSLEQSFYEFKTQSDEVVAYSKVSGKYFLANAISVADTKELFNKVSYLDKYFGYDEDGYEEIEDHLWGDVGQEFNPTEVLLPNLAMELEITSFEVIADLLYMLHSRYDRLSRTSLIALDQTIQVLSLVMEDYPYDIIVDKDTVTFSLKEGQEIIYDAEHSPITFTIEEE